MNTKAILMAAAFFSLTVSFTAGAQDDTAAAGVSRVELLATASNIVNQPIAYPAGAAKVTAELVSFEPAGHTALHDTEFDVSSYVSFPKEDLAKLHPNCPMELLNGKFRRRTHVV